MHRRTRLALTMTAAAAVVAMPIAAAMAPAGASSAAITTAAYTYSVAGIPGITGTVTGTIELNLPASEAEVTVNLPSAISLPHNLGKIGPGAITVIVDGSTVYAQVPGLNTIPGLVSFLGSKTWISVSSGASATWPSSVATAADDVLGNVPGLITELTTKPAGHPIATVTSTSTSNGSTTTNLTVTAPKAGAKSPVAKPLHALFQGLKRHKGHAGTTSSPVSIPVSVTANSLGELTAASTSVTVGTTSFTASITSTGYGQSLTITPPTPSQTLTISPSILKMAETFLGSMHGGTHGWNPKGLASGFSL